MMISLVSVKPSCYSNCRHFPAISFTSFGQKYALYTMFVDMLMIIQHVETIESKNSRFHA